MNRIKWNTYIDINDTLIPRDTDLLITVQHIKTKERKVVVLKLINHKITPSAAGHLCWVGLDSYFFTEYKIVAWSKMVAPAKANVWYELNEKQYKCSECETIWNSSDAPIFKFCPSCGEYKGGVIQT